MGSLVAYFHKHFEIQERKFRATNVMKKNVKRVQTQAAHLTWPKCGKCEEYFKKGDLLHDDLSNEDLCTQCTNAIKVLRDV